MRHRKADKKLNRSMSLRKATLRDIAKSVIKYQSIKTTLAKAKEARKQVDRLITLGKQADLHSRRRAFQELCDHSLVSSLFNDIAPRFTKVNGGYTRILPWGNRRGDNAHIAILELTIKDSKDKTAKKKPKDKEKHMAALKTKASIDEKSSKPKTSVKESKKYDKPKDVEVPEKPKPIIEQEEPKKVPEQIKEDKKEPPKKILKGLRKFFRKERNTQ